MNLEFLGWIGSFALAICALPQAIQCIKTKSAEGVSPYFLILWWTGEIITLVYIICTTMQWPLIVNYIFNIACITVIMFFKMKEEP